MRFGFVFPGGQPNDAVDAAVLAEASGWDGFFMWDPVWGVEPWVTLAAVAVRTERIRLGTMITPVSRCRPWKLAGETATLDRLSRGRVILSVGLGAVDTGFEAFGEEVDRRSRAELLDEGLEIVTGLWRGQPFQFDGKHYHVRESSFVPAPPPVQQPRIPIWVVGAWPRPRSMRRVLRYDGLLPDVMSPDGRHRAATPDDVRGMMAFVQAERAGDRPFDVVVEGETPAESPDRAGERVRPFAAAGATWWLEAMWSATDTMWEPATQGRIRARIAQGPPVV